MARFAGKIGFGHTVEKRPGVHDVVITEKGPYFGDVVRNSRGLQEAEKVNLDISVTNSISIVADAYVTENIFAIRYVEWAGSLWIVDEVTVEAPRLLLRLGGVYNGPKVSASNTP